MIVFLFYIYWFNKDMEIFGRIEVCFLGVSKMCLMVDCGVGKREGVSVR